MKFRTRQITWVEVEHKVPHYYVHYFNESTCYGRIDAEEEITIDIKDNEQRVLIEIEATDSNDDSYFDPKYKSTKQSFLRALQRAKDILARCEETEIGQNANEKLGIMGATYRPPSQ